MRRDHMREVVIKFMVPEDPRAMAFDEAQPMLDHVEYHVRQLTGPMESARDVLIAYAVKPRS